MMMMMMMTSASPGRGDGDGAARPTGSSTTIGKFRSTDGRASVRPSRRAPLPCLPLEQVSDLKVRKLVGTTRRAGWGHKACAALKLSAAAGSGLGGASDIEDPSYERANLP
jgi:hypothetical protein